MQFERSAQQRAPAGTEKLAFAAMLSDVAVTAQAAQHASVASSKKPDGGLKVGPMM